MIQGNMQLGTIDPMVEDELTKIICGLLTVIAGKHPKIIKKQRINIGLFCDFVSLYDVHCEFVPHDSIEDEIFLDPETDIIQIREDIYDILEDDDRNAERLRFNLLFKIGFLLCRNALSLEYKSTHVDLVIAALLFAEIVSLPIHILGVKYYHHRRYLMEDIALPLFNDFLTPKYPIHHTPFVEEIFPAELPVEADVKVEFLNWVCIEIRNTRGTLREFMDEVSEYPWTPISSEYPWTPISWEDVKCEASLMPLKYYLLHR